MEVEEIRTPRLLLKQLHTNDVGSQDLEWFHRIWSHELATQWSSRGPCKSIGDSQQWMAGILPRNATGKQVKIAFAVLPIAAGHSPTTDAEALGIVTLLSSTFRLPSEAPAGPADDGTVVELGYLFHPNAWGKGYATESLRAFLGAYVQQRTAREPGTLFEVRASAHSQNAASLRVLSKLGFEELGRFEQEGRLPLALHGQTSPVVGVHLRMKK
ncbi:hypothetical protein VTI74DRAFT_9938 [Chaetomium olivicolor]